MGHDLFDLVYGVFLLDVVEVVIYFYDFQFYSVEDLLVLIVEHIVLAVLVIENILSTHRIYKFSELIQLIII